MAKYAERLNQLLEDGKLTQAEYDELADLSIAKEAIKEFNQVKAERDQLAAFKQNVETTPLRKEALKRVGIDYDALPKYGQETLDSIPADDLKDLDKVASFVQSKGFEANVSADEAGQGQSQAEAITDFASTASTGTPTVRKNTKEAFEAAVAAAQTPSELDAVYKDFGREPAANNTSQ